MEIKCKVSHCPIFLPRWRTVEYYIIRSKGNLDIMDAVDLIGQTSEFARVFGIEFYHVLSRGSQVRDKGAVC